MSGQLRAPERSTHQRTAHERSVQQVDPIGALSARPLTIGAAIAAPLIALIFTLQRPQEIDRPDLMITAFALLIGACVLLVYSSHAQRAPFTGGSHSIVMSLAALAALLSAMSHWTSDSYVRDDWGQLALGILLAAASPYRPVRSLLLAGASATVYIGVLVFLQSPSFVTVSPPVTTVLIAVTPVAALSCAGAVYASAAITSLERRQAAASEAAHALVATPGDRHQRPREQERVNILARVVPLFATVLANGTVTADIADRAGALSGAVRTIMVAEANRSWLGNAVNEAAGVQNMTVQDGSKLSDSLSFGQRTAVRALLDALFAAGAFDARGFSAVVAADGVRTTISLTTAPREGRVATKQVLEPYLAVMRSLFPVVEVGITQTIVKLRFCYEQER
jgi:hypothetical protein